MTTAELVARLNAVQSELASCRRRLKDTTLPAEMRARYETRVLIYEGFNTALRAEWDAARAKEAA